MLGYLFMTFFYMIPIASIAFFVVSLCCYIDAKKKHKTDPNEINTQNKNKCRTNLIVSSVIMGVLLTIVIGFMALMYMAIAYM